MTAKTLLISLSKIELDQIRAFNFFYNQKLEENKIQARLSLLSQIEMQMF